MSRPGAGAAVAAAPPGRLALALRLPVLVAVTGGLGLAGHVLADRDLPPPRLLALGLVVVAVLVLPLRRRQAGPAVIAGALLGGQAALHLVLCLCHCTTGSPFADVVHRVLCPDDAHAVAWAGDPLRVVPGGEPTGYLAHVWPGHAMVLAHVAAALVAAWWLRRGEAAAHAALRAVPSLRLPVAAAVGALPAPATVPAPALAPVLTDQVRLLLTRPRRGPPVVVRPVEDGPSADLPAAVPARPVPRDREDHPMSFHRSRPTALLAAAVLAAALSACSGASSSSGAGTPEPTTPVTTSSAAPTTSDAATPSPTTPDATTSSPAEDDGQVVEISVAKNKVSGPKGRVKVKLGSKVTLRVTSDVADEIHLHGYDKSTDVEAGGTADLKFTANVAGVFEVELESRALQLAQLQVQ